jgi:predicted short-subunit dehydrogenase-like oxidoreductase (DUF2520 family)
MANEESIGIVGAGRVAQALGRFLSDSGQPVVAIAGRDSARTAAAARFIGTYTAPVPIVEIPAVASRVLIAVSDSAIESVAGILGQSGFRRGIVLHTCGAKGPEELSSLAAHGVSCGTLHPIQSFSSPEASLAGSSFGVDGHPDAVAWASSIVKLAGGSVLRVQNRGLYHAAAVMASNYVGAMIHAAIEVLAAAGVERTAARGALQPLVTTSVENSFHLGPIDALTGPIQRGDSSTVQAHLTEIRNLPDSVRRLYCSAGELVVQMALARGLHEAKAFEIQKMLRADS